MAGPWKVTTNIIGDNKRYAVFRLIDINEIDHSGNREFATEYMGDKTEAQAIAAELNEKEKSPLKAD